MENVDRCNDFLNITWEVNTNLQKIIGESDINSKKTFFAKHFYQLLLI